MSDEAKAAPKLVGADQPLSVQQAREANLEQIVRLFRSSKEHTNEDGKLLCDFTRGCRELDIDVDALGVPIIQRRLQTRGLLVRRAGEVYLLLPEEVQAKPPEVQKTTLAAHEEVSQTGARLAHEALAAHDLKGARASLEVACKILDDLIEERPL